jgi:hypothetical protein
MIYHVAFVRTSISEERSTSIIRVTGISELGTTLAVTNNQRTLQRYTVCSARRLLVTANVPSSHSCHPDDGGATFHRNVSSYKHHMS